MMNAGRGKLEFCDFNAKKLGAQPKQQVHFFTHLPGPCEQKYLAFFSGKDFFVRNVPKIMFPSILYVVFKQVTENCTQDGLS